MLVPSYHCSYAICIHAWVLESQVYWEDVLYMDTYMYVHLLVCVGVVRCALMVCAYLSLHVCCEYYYVITALKPQALQLWVGI